MTDAEWVAYVKATRAAQGLPEFVNDLAVLQRVATVIRASLMAGAADANN